MSILNMIGIATAQAATTAPAGHQSAAAGFLSMLPMLIIFVAVFYFLLVRPQQKRAKEHKALMDSLSVGDEVVTTGGMIGRLSKLRDNFVVITFGKDLEIAMQRGAISSVLPKGTIETI